MSEHLSQRDQLSAKQRFERVQKTPSLSSSSSGHPLLENASSDPLWLLNAAREPHCPVNPVALSNLLYVRNINRLFLEAMDTTSSFEVKPWTKDADGKSPTSGGGVMSTIRGREIEKSAVNMSLVVGDKYPSIESEYAGKPFTACGVSLICHPHNPYAPISHMNVRVLSVGEGSDKQTWIGGGGDLTPMIPQAEDTELFHNALKEACENHPLGDYPRFRDWCDEYFFIPHRNQTRGVGGIFFDYIKISDAEETQFLTLVGEAFCRAYAEILSRRLETPFTDEEKEQHLYWRGRYAEFNLVYDRGTRFGLMSGGNVEAIFGSLPPVVKW